MGRLLRAGLPLRAGALMVLMIVSAVSGRAADQAIFVAPLDTPGMVKLSLFIPYRAETPGLAHYAEHLTWQSAIGREVKLGDPHSNAMAAQRAVTYYMSGPPGETAAMLRTLARVFEPIDLADSFAIEERGIVEREYDLSIGGKPGTKMFERMNPFLYDGTVLGVSMMGTLADIRSFTPEQAKAFHAATHRPERATLLAEGDITAEQLAKALAEVDFPALAPRSALEPSTISLAPPAEKVFTDPEAEVAPRMLWNKVVALPEPVPYDRLKFHADLLDDILISALQGGLAGPLRYDSFTARVFDVWIIVPDERHIEINISAEPDAGIGFAELRQAVEKALAQSGQGIPQASYERVLKRFRAAVPPPSDRAANLKRMADYIYASLLDQRLPLDEAARRALLDQFDPASSTVSPPP